MTLATWPTVASSLRHRASFSHNDTLLPPGVAARGVEHAGDDSLLGCVRRRLRSRLPVTVAALGGSISAGSSYSVRYGGSAAWLYHAKVVQALRTAFPLAHGMKPHVHHNGALPATGPAFFEHCVEGQLPSSAPTPQVVLLEFGVNTDGEPAAFERLLRKLLGLEPPLALVVVNTHVWTLKGKHRVCWKGARRSTVSMDEPEQRASQTWEDRFNFGDEDAIARLCTHYNVPLVSMRSALLEEVKKGADPTLALRHFMVDCKHPSGQGHTYLAQLVLWRLLHGIGATTARSPSLASSSSATSSAGGASAGDGDSTTDAEDLTCEAASTRAAARMLPTPVYSDGWPRGASRCVNGEALQTLSSVAARGFYFTDEMRNKFGWVGSTPGDELSFCLVDDTAGLLRVSGTGVAAARQQQPQQQPPPQQQPELLQQQQPELQRRMRLAARLSSTPHECVDREGTWAFPQPFPRRPTQKLSCLEMSSWCGDSKFPSLLEKCPLSCGMCSPSAGPGTTSASLALWLGYLRSYEHMGRATVTCAGSCTCVPSEIDAHLSPSKDVPRVSVTAVRRIAIKLVSSPNGTGSAAPIVAPAGYSPSDGSRLGCCQLRIRIEQATSSGEHKFKLLALLLAQPRASDHWQPPGTKVWAGATLDMMHMPNASSFDEVDGARPRVGSLSAARRTRRAKGMVMKGSGGGGGKRSVHNMLS
jgi:hypothetical protein